MLPETPTHKQLHNFVAEQMRTAILAGHFKPGEWLRQERIAQEFGVSQMPVREAIKQLVAEGLIEHVPYRGARVIALSAIDIQDLYQHRAFLEGLAARSAAKNITPEEIEELKQLQAQMEFHRAPEQVQTYRDLNRRFHQLVFTASRHEYLIRTLNQMWEAFPTMLIANFAATATQPLPGREEVDIDEHSHIVIALENHDEEAAGNAMREHILNAGQGFVRSLGDPK